jgi:hypothetical protein
MIYHDHCWIQNEKMQIFSTIPAEIVLLATAQMCARDVLFTKND